MMATAALGFALAGSTYWGENTLSAIQTDQKSTESHLINTVMMVVTLTEQVAHLEQSIQRLDKRLISLEETITKLGQRLPKPEIKPSSSNDTS